jgi:hypothetical protein
MAEAIDWRLGKGQQTVRVEPVTVQGGGQAIVGAVATPERLEGGGIDDRSPQQAQGNRLAAELQSARQHRQRPALRRPDASWQQLPGAGHA